MISIIVPVYNVDKYLIRCIDSILKQSYKYFELILIDDGASDSCGKICDIYLNLDKRVKVIHQKNNGVSYARNIGIELLQGKLITFCDSDDYVDTNWLWEMVENLIRNSVDCISTEFKMVDEDGNVLWIPNFKKQVYTFKDCFSKYYFILNSLLNYQCGCEIWHTLFKSKIIIDNNIRFNSKCGGYAEDLQFIMEYVLYCNSIKVTDSKHYFYFQRKDSIMHTEGKYTFRMDSLNEVSCGFLWRLKNVDRNNYSLLAPIFHYGIMATEYGKYFLNKDTICNLPYDLKKIKEINHYKQLTKNIIFRKKQIKQYYEKKRVAPIMYFSLYCLHHCFKLYQFCDVIYYKIILKE